MEDDDDDDDDDDTDDLELLGAWQNGDKSAGHRLFRRYLPTVQRFVYNKVPDDGREELIQQTFLGCVKGVQGFREDSSFKTYILSIALRRIADYYRRLEKRAAIEGVDNIDDVGRHSVAMLSTGSPFTQVVKRRDQQLLNQALRHIPLDDQTVIELFYWEDMSGSEIARVLGLKEPAIRSRLRRAKKRLKEQIELLASNPREAQSTLETLNTWAAKVRERIGSDDVDGEGE